MIDSHAHPNLDPLLADVDGVCNRAKSQGVSQLIAVGTDIQSSEIAVDLAQTHPMIGASVGVHPEFVQDTQNLTDSEWEVTLQSLKQTLTHLQTSPEVKAIGECGLDYCFLQTIAPQEQALHRQRQQKLCSMQIKLAQEYNLTCIFHCRSTQKSTDIAQVDAYEDLLSLITDHYTQGKFRFVLHCASGPIDYIQKALALGAYVSFAGNITYPSAESIRQLLSVVPLERLLLETDAPFLAPQTKRGQTNEPSFLKQTGAVVASLLHISYEELDSITTANTNACFSL